MQNFKHFETLAKAKKFIADVQAGTVTTSIGHPSSLVTRKKQGKHAKPYAVATRLTHLHFTPDSWVKGRKKR